MRAKRLAMLPALVLVYALVAEAGLQIAAFFVQRSTRAQMPVAWVTGNVRILCLGDSNTYGLWVDRSQAYPQQLEALWNQRVETPKLEVLNLGFPGTNSSRVVRELPGMLETLDPDVVIVMVGVNDFWTLPTPLEGTAASAPPATSWMRHSLLYRLYHTLQRERIANEPEYLRDPNPLRKGAGAHKVRVGDREFDMGYAVAPQGLEGDVAGMAANLLRVVRQARDAGTSLYLMTYPSRQYYYYLANNVIRGLARETGTPLINLTAIFLPICPQNDCPEKMFPDGHPNASGYRLVAETIVERLARGDSP
jgi:lysophospholipase L1-like esterase